MGSDTTHLNAVVMFQQFMADHHRITKELLQYTKDLFATGTYTLKQMSEITGLSKNTVKAIDLKRLQDPMKRITLISS